MWSWFTFWLILHILAAIVAFGPTVTFPIIAARARKDPQHGAFGAALIEFIQKRVTLPVALVIPVTGVGLIYSAPGQINLWKSEWLVISIVLFAFAYVFSLFVQMPSAGRLLRLLRSMPPGPPPEGAGPPPEVAGLGKKLQMGGQLLSLLVVAILVLMIWKPGNCQGIC